MRFFVLCTILTLMSHGALGSTPTAALNEQMDKILVPLRSSEGWKNFITTHADLFGQVSAAGAQSFLGVVGVPVTVDGDKYEIGMGCRSVYIAAPPKTVVDLVNNPHFFQSMYGLDKTAVIDEPSADGTFKARVYKLVPGIETQDYILGYSGSWQSDGSWIGQSKQLEDAKGFALRNNMKIIEPSGSGCIYREVALLYPMRWWVRLFHGLAQNIFKSELGKLNKSLKCVAEKIQKNTPMSDDLAKACYKESQK